MNNSFRLEYRLKQMLEESSDICKEYDIPKPKEELSPVVLSTLQMDAMDETHEYPDIIRGDSNVYNSMEHRNTENYDI